MHCFFRAYSPATLHFGASDYMLLDWATGTLRAPPPPPRSHPHQVDRNISQRLKSAYRAGREVNLNNILQHELVSVPLSLSTTSGILHSANQFLLADVFTQDGTTSATVSLAIPKLSIDGEALVMALSKPLNNKFFGDYARTFANTVYKMGAILHLGRCSMSFW